MTGAETQDSIVRTRKFEGTVSVNVGGEVIARSENAVELLEEGYPATLYVPQADIDMAKLTRSDTKTLCPHKGIANYWTYRANGDTIEDIAWMYATPVSTVGDIAGHLAFYADKVQSITVD